MKPTQLLTRSKIKMQQSIRHTRQDLPYFNQQEDFRYPYKQPKAERTQEISNMYVRQSDYQSGVEYAPKYNNFRTQFSQIAAIDNGVKKNNLNRNEILRQLRQQYQILKNLNIEDSIHIHVKKYDRPNQNLYEGNSEESSSVHSKKQSKVKGKEYKTQKQEYRQIQSLILQKKQLEIVVSNSMRKIEELLNNQINLKKNIHELKTQIQGKGGISHQYEKVIKNLQKNQEELISQIQKAKHQNERNLHKIKQMNDKIRYYESEISAKERQIKNNFDQQKKLHELIRNQKDKYLHMQIQYKSYKMQYQLLEKQKNNQINRLIRQLENQSNGNDKQTAYLIKRLEEDIKEKDKRYHDLVLERERQFLKKDRDNSEYINDKKSEKNILQEMLYKSKELNQYNNKALNDSMALIFNKMSQLQRKNDDTLKKQIEAIKKKTQQNRKNTNESQLLARVIELEKMIERQVEEKKRLGDDILKLKSHKSELENYKIQIEEKHRLAERKVKELNERQDELKKQIQDLEQIRSHYQLATHENKSIKEHLNLHTQKIKEYEQHHENQRSKIQNLQASWRQKQKQYEDQIKILRRKIDEIDFQVQKAKKQGQFNLTIYKASQESQINRIKNDYNRKVQQVNEYEVLTKKLRDESDKKLEQKSNEILNLKNAIETLKSKHQEQLQNQKTFFEEKHSKIQLKYTTDIKTFNEKFLAISGSNEKLLSQIANYSTIEREVIELRRNLRQSKSLSVGVDHLWQIKEAEYANINQILRTAAK